MKGFLCQQEERKGLANNFLSYDRGKGYLTPDRENMQADINHEGGYLSC